MKAVLKKIVCISLTVVMVMALTGCGDKARHEEAKKKYGSDKLTVFLPGEYIDDDVIPSFEKKFGVTVNVEEFDSNESMYTKFASGDKYDVLIPSDYMIERLMKENKLQKIDKSLIPNMNVLCAEVQNLSFDPTNDYSVPYFWGNFGIVYDTRKVTLSDLEAKDYEILRDTRYKGDIFMYDSERDGFLVAFKSLGYSCNSEDEQEIQEAYEWLLELGNTMKPVYVTDEVIDGMINGNKALALVYSGDAVTILEENENMSYYVPKCGSNVFCDSMVIPANAENPKLAHEFINYMLSYEISKKNTLAVGYTSPNAKVLDEMIQNDFADNIAYVPRKSDKDELYHDNEFLRKKLSELWTKVIATQ